MIMRSIVLLTAPSDTVSIIDLSARPPRAIAAGIRTVDK